MRKRTSEPGFGKKFYWLKTHVQAHVYTSRVPCHSVVFLALDPAGRVSLVGLPLVHVLILPRVILLDCVKALGVKVLATGPLEDCFFFT